MVNQLIIVVIGAALLATAAFVVLRALVRSETADLRQQVADLSTGVAMLQAALVKPAGAPASQPAPSPAPAPALETPDETITPEILAVLSAAVAAFLGKRVRVRHARRIPGAGSSAWAQQGRVSVQASHYLARS